MIEKPQAMVPSGRPEMVKLGDSREPTQVNKSSSGAPSTHGAAIANATGSTISSGVVVASAIDSV